jgi:hypothetical protein
MIIEKVDIEEYRVFRFVIESLNKNPFPRDGSNMIIIAKSTSVKDLDYPESSIKGLSNIIKSLAAEGTIKNLDQEAYEDFAKKNRESVQLIRWLLPLKTRLKFIENKEIEYYESGRLDSLLEEKFSGAMSIHVLSRVGFNHDMTKAFIYIRVYYFEGEYFVSLIKIDGNWRIEHLYFS